MNFSIQKAGLTDCILGECHRAENFQQRVIGLLGRSRPLSLNEGLWLDPCWSVHFWGMSISIDVLFIRKEACDTYRITSSYSKVAPWRFFPLWDWKATSVLELPVHFVDRSFLYPGDLLWIRPIFCEWSQALKKPNSRDRENLSFS